MTHLRILLPLLLIISLSACSTITTGTTQDMTVQTPYAKGASCTLKDSKNAQWGIFRTPGTVIVNKGDGPMKITCRKQGHKENTVMVEEEFAGATLGNILVGGIIGVGIDAASGAAQKYPSNVLVWMEPNNFSSEQSRTLWFKEKEKYADKAVISKNSNYDNHTKTDSFLRIPERKSREQARLLWHSEQLPKSNN